MNSPDVAANLLACSQPVTQNYPRAAVLLEDRPLAGPSGASGGPPTKVVLWQATNPQARDFRLETIGPAWTSQPLTGQNGIYDVSMPAPAQGWRRSLSN